MVEPYGFCFARRGAEIHAILVGHEGEVRQFVVTADANGQPASREVRRGERLFVSDWYGSRLRCLTLAGDHVWTAPTGKAPAGVALSGDGRIVAVADRDDPTAVVWKRLADLLPDYWLTALTGDAHPGWLR